MDRLSSDLVNEAEAEVVNATNATIFRDAILAEREENKIYFSRIPKGKSLAHDFFMSNKAAFVSLNTEIGGENCGIIKLSAEIC